MVIENLVKDIRSHLVLSAEIDSDVGGRLVVGETFKVKLAIKNTFRNHDEGGSSYKNIVVWVRGTQYAEIVGVNDRGIKIFQVTTDYNNVLPMGISVVIADVVFKAKKAFTVYDIINEPVQTTGNSSNQDPSTTQPPEFITASDLLEPYATYGILADFDYEELFKVSHNDKLYVQIEPLVLLELRKRSYMMKKKNKKA